jgi:hypothetical protein
VIVDSSETFLRALAMLFALLGLGLAELAAVGFCCGAVSIGIAIAVVLLLFTGKRSADPDDTKRNRDEKARREQAEEFEDEPADRETGFKGEKWPNRDTTEPADDGE